MGKRINLFTANSNTYPNYSESSSDDENYSDFQSRCMTPSSSTCLESDSDNESCNFQEGAKSQNFLSDFSSDQMASLVGNMASLTANITNATISVPEVEKNFEHLCGAFPELGRNSLKRSTRISLGDKSMDLCIRAAEVKRFDNRLPIKESMYKDTVQLSSSIPFKLQRSLGITTILDLLKQKFPELTQSICDQKITRRVFAVPVPLNQRKRGSFFPEIKVDNGLIAYVAWDSSGLQVAHGLKKEKCAILFEDNTAFCGEVLSQQNLEGIERGAGVSAYFMTAGVTVIGVFVPQSPRGRYENFASELSDPFKQKRIACDAPCLRERGGGPKLSPSTDTLFGMLGVRGSEVTTDQRADMPDRRLSKGEKLSLFCLEFVPQFHSKGNPVTTDDLEMAIEIPFQHLSDYAQKI